MIDIQAKIRHQALSNAAALKEVGEFVERISKKDEEATHAAATFDPSTVKVPPSGAMRFHLRKKNRGCTPLKSIRLLVTSCLESASLRRHWTTTSVPDA